MFPEQDYAHVPIHETKRLIPSSVEDEKVLPSTAHSRRKTWSRTLVVLFHGLLIALYILAFLCLQWQGEQSSYRPTQRYALAREALEYELRYFEDPTKAGGVDSQAWLYAGQPRPELEAAWENLLKNADIRVTNEEMRFLGHQDEGMRLTDGSGYYAQMAVHHNLHCIRGFHKFMNVNHYFPNITMEEWQLLQVHNIHCLDMLRQAIMCQGDTSPLTMTWDSKLQLAVANWTTPHECVSWEALDGWAAGRHVDMNQPGIVDVPVPDVVRQHGRIPIVLDVDER